MNMRMQLAPTISPPAPTKEEVLKVFDSLIERQKESSFWSFLVSKVEPQRVFMALQGENFRNFIISSASLDVLDDVDYVSKNIKQNKSSGPVQNSFDRISKAYDRYLATKEENELKVAAAYSKTKN